MMRILRLLSMSFMVMMPVSCNMVSALLHDENVVARVGSNKLYESEVAQLIPHGTSPEDSLKFVIQYANAWASDMIYLDIAESQLSKSEKDVTKELEAYRRSLLKYRYEQLFINERLDTSVTDEELEEYYEAHASDFVLARPIVKARYMKVHASSPDLGTLKNMMASSEYGSVEGADSLVYSATLKFSSYNDDWIDITVLAKDMELDYTDLLSVKSGKFIENTDKSGRANIAFISEIVEAFHVPPIEYCEGAIIDRILSARKHYLISDLEHDLLEDAKAKGKFVIY